MNRIVAAVVGGMLGVAMVGLGWLHQPTTAVAAVTLVPPSVPTEGAYLGAFVSPAGSGGELHQLSGFEHSLAAPLAIVHIYSRWQDPPTNAELEAIRATGAIPMVDWTCGTVDSDIYSGSQEQTTDALISGFARQLAALGSPVFLRWFWEPNLPGSPIDQRCLGPGGTSLQAAGYKDAFQRMHDLFQQAGATNVAFVWSINTSGSQTSLGHYFYPGSKYVDWIAADGYDRLSTSAPLTVCPQGASDCNTQEQAFAEQFSTWYATYSRLGKPMMIAETGAQCSPPGNTTHQACASPGAGTIQQAYLQGALAEMRLDYPNIKAFMYFDAPGTFHWELSGSGFQAFNNMSSADYLQPPRTESEPLVTGSVLKPESHPRLSLTAAISPSDGGGLVTFLTNGVPLTGCSDRPLSLGPTGWGASCKSADLAPGSDDVVASYSGSAEYAPSQSAAVVMTVPKPLAPGSTARGAPTGLGSVGLSVGAIAGPITVALPPSVAPFHPNDHLAPGAFPVPEVSNQISSFKPASDPPGLLATPPVAKPVLPFGRPERLILLGVGIALSTYVAVTWIVDRLRARRHLRTRGS